MPKETRDSQKDIWETAFSNVGWGHGGGTNADSQLEDIARAITEISGISLPPPAQLPPPPPEPPQPHPDHPPSLLHSPSPTPPHSPPPNKENTPRPQNVVHGHRSRTASPVQV